MTNPTTPTDDKAERERCHRVVFGRGPASLTFQVDEMVRERALAYAAGDQAGYMRGYIKGLTWAHEESRREGEAVGYEKGVAAAKEDAWHEGYREADAIWRKNTSSDATVFAKQGAQLTRLTEAARAAEKHLSVHIHAASPMLTELRAALAQAPAADGEGMDWRARYEELAASVDAYAKAPANSERDQIYARVELWKVRNRHKNNPKRNASKEATCTCQQQWTDPNCKALIHD